MWTTRPYVKPYSIAGHVSNKGNHDRFAPAQNVAGK
jgi:hypothetical protein